MWVAGINRPYYPRVEFFETEENAKQYYKELLEEHEQDGKYDVQVFIAKVEVLTEIQTEY